MKIIAFGVRKDELPYFEKFADEFSIEYATTSKELTPETAHLAEGFDGVSDYTSSEALNDVWPTFKEMGIKYFSVRTAGFDGIDLEKAKEYIEKSGVARFTQ